MGVPSLKLTNNRLWKMDGWTIKAGAFSLISSGVYLLLVLSGSVWYSTRVSWIYHLQMGWNCHRHPGTNPPDGLACKFWTSGSLGKIALHTSSLVSGGVHFVGESRHLGVWGLLEIAFCLSRFFLSNTFTLWIESQYIYLHFTIWIVYMYIYIHLIYLELPSAKQFNVFI